MYLQNSIFNLNRLIFQVIQNGHVTRRFTKTCWKPFNGGQIQETSWREIGEANFDGVTEAHLSDGLDAGSFGDG